MEFFRSGLRHHVHNRARSRAVLGLVVAKQHRHLADRIRTRVEFERAAVVDVGRLNTIHRDVVRVRSAALSTETTTVARECIALGRLGDSGKQ